MEYKEGIAQQSCTRERRSSGPFSLAFLLVVLAVEMVVANGIPKTNPEMLNQFSMTLER